MNRLIAKAKTYSRILWYAIKWIPKINILDEVWFLGEKHIVSNMVRPGSVRLPNVKNGDDGWIPLALVRKVKTPYNYFFSFRSGWRFYVGNWAGIWIREEIEKHNRQLSQ
jgi:hypothetical protein